MQAIAYLNCLSFACQASGLQDLLLVVLQSLAASETEPLADA